MRNRVGLALATFTLACGSPTTSPVLSMTVSTTLGTMASTCPGGGGLTVLRR